ncbi:Zinc-binding oxidoreductase [Handroanthus impetiginosus]|uniref:Zinc-binding oxidoreductase n=1 Tax=Handroanthus impetiginosus TaxID=429701 RepID=A0A2G9HMD8_9LAMI|nr:Zinc-binding oxidoreductase [Handroanthus impetiginosus]
MEALICRNLGDPILAENAPLILSCTHPIPQINSPTAVRIRIIATSLNFSIYLQILGKYQEKPPLPFIPGSDHSGTVEAVGHSVTKFEIGDPVCGFAAVGSFAEYLVPKGCDLVAAGALLVSYGTSHMALVHRAQLHAGQLEKGKMTMMFVDNTYKNYLLVSIIFIRSGIYLYKCNMCSGGVGVAAIQIGKILGATIIVVARGEEKVKFLKSLGVDHIVDLTKETCMESVKGFLKKRRLKGVDVLYDPVGGKLTKETLKFLNWGAQILVIGFGSGEVPIIPANIALVKNWTVHGMYCGGYLIHQPHILEDSVKELLSWLAKGLITIKISHTYSLSEANLAFTVLKDRKAIGKVVIVFNEQKEVRSKL